MGGVREAGCVCVGGGGVKPEGKNITSAAPGVCEFANEERIVISIV